MNKKIVFLFIYLLTCEAFAAELPSLKETTETINKIENCERLSCSIKYFSSELVKQNLNNLYKFNGSKREALTQGVEKTLLYHKFSSTTKIISIKKNKVMYDTSDLKLKIEFIFVYENGTPVIGSIVHYLD